MANFQRAPQSLLDHPPAVVSPPIRKTLAQAGTYTLFDEKGYALKVPLGNATWKAHQARVVAVWGGDDGGGRLVITAKDPIVQVTPVSEQPIDSNLWAYILTGKLVGHTILEAKTSRGLSYCRPLSVTVLPETASPPALPLFAGGNRAAAITAIAVECRRQALIDTQLAYVLATAEHETANTFQPIRETGNVAHPLGNEGARRRMRYYPYYGRGYVQLTWEANYRAFGRRLAVDLAADPDLAMQANIALFVMVHGMMHGNFGSPLPQHVNATKTDFLHARHCVNAMDMAQHIAGLATAWLAQIKAGNV
jgi:hypothetical protein